MPTAGFMGCRHGAGGSDDPWGKGPEVSSGTRTQPALATTNQVTGTGRDLWSAADQAGVRSRGAQRFWLGNGTNRGGLTWDVRFALGADNASTRCFVGLALVDAYLCLAGNPSAQGTIPMVGVGFDDTSNPGDDFRLFHSSGGGSVTSTQLTGINRSTTQWLVVRITAQPNSSSILVELTRRESSGTLTQQSMTLTTNIPAATDQLYSQAAVNGTGVASSAQITIAEGEFRTLPVSSSILVDRTIVYRTGFQYSTDPAFVSDWGTVSITGAGTRTAGALSTTNYLQSRPRVRSEATSATSAIGWRMSNQGRVWRGNGGGLGGFDVTLLLGFENHLTSVRGFLGIGNQNSDFLMNQGNPSALTSQQFIGFGWDSTEGAGANLRLCSNDGSAGVTYSDVVGIARNAASILRARFSCAPNASAIDVELEDLTSDILYQDSISTNLPGNTQFMGPDISARGAIGQTACLIGGWHRRVI